MFLLSRSTRGEWIEIYFNFIKTRDADVSLHTGRVD